MYGEVLSVDEATGDGLIVGEDRRQHPFAASACRGRLRPRQKVEFELRDGAAVDIFKVSAARHSLGLQPPKGEFRRQQELERAIDAPLDWRFLLGSLNGRIGRQPFIGIWIALNLAGFVLNLIPAIGWLLALVLFWPRVAIQTKRLHDMGLSGWLQLLPVGLTALAYGFAAAGAPLLISVGAGTLLLATGAINLAFFIWLAATAGKTGPNRFGDDPRGQIEEVFA
jgi:uncharacterized membrane protein YhaH (DUF805 family)